MWEKRVTDLSVAFLFPGQGSQVPGMLHKLPDHPVIRQTLEEVRESLGVEVPEIDTPEALRSTDAVPLALLASGVAVARALMAEGAAPEAVAGMSAGAFSAAIAAGVLDLADGVRLIKQRGEMMVELYPHGYGLAAIVGLTEKEVSTLVAEVFTTQQPVYVANINAPRQIVIAGSDQGMNRGVQAAPKKGGLEAAGLEVSEPSHCLLLNPGADALKISFQKERLQDPALLY